MLFCLSIKHFPFQYEAEDGHTEDQRPVRFAVDAGLFPDYKYRGYAVFSPIQEKIIMDIDVAKVRSRCNANSGSDRDLSASGNCAYLSY